MKIGRLVLVALVASTLSVPASAAVSPDARAGGEVLELAREQLARVGAELR
jgi:hypothetical protein